MYRHKADCAPFSLPDLEPLSEDGIHRQEPVRALHGAHQYIRFVPDSATILPQDFFRMAINLLNRTITEISDNCSHCKMHPVLQVDMAQVDQYSG